MSERILRWESPQRYYAVRVQQDLLGDWVMACAWGGLNNNKGNMVSQPTPADSLDFAVSLIDKQRTRHHYRLVEDRTE